jgi:hypothetical protein
LDEDEDDGKEDRESSDNSDCDFQSSMDDNEDGVALPRAAPYGIDRPRAFVIDDAPYQPPACYTKQGRSKEEPTLAVNLHDRMKLRWLCENGEPKNTPR